MHACIAQFYELLVKMHW